MFRYLILNDRITFKVFSVFFFKINNLTKRMIQSFKKKTSTKSTTYKRGDMSELKIYEVTTSILVTSVMATGVHHAAELIREMFPNHKIYSIVEKSQ